MRGARPAVRPLLLGLVAGLLAWPAGAGKREAAAPPLAHETVHPSGAFSFRTPESWRVGSPPGRPTALQAEGEGLIVRFLFENTEIGYDGLHANCMLEGLGRSGMDSEPRVRYEYDFLSGKVGERRALDSAFFMTYDAPILGHREWRQRNLTLVGAGQSLCVITYAPAEVWKKSKAVRQLLDAIVGSVAFR